MIDGLDQSSVVITILFIIFENFVVTNFATHTEIRKVILFRNKRESVLINDVQLLILCLA